MNFTFTDYIRSYIKLSWLAFELSIVRNISAAEVYIFFDILASLALETKLLIKKRVTSSFHDFTKLYPE